MVKLVINISEEDYNECKFREHLLSLGGDPADLTFNMRIETLIAKGTLLEEVLEDIKSEIRNKKDGYGRYPVCDNCIKIIDKYISEPDDSSI